MNTEQKAVSIEAVTKRFGSLTAVDDVSFTVPVGEVMALLGPNGAGKTTLLDMILGFTKQNAGRIEVLGSQPTAATTGGRVGAVLQTRGLLDDLSVRETLQMVAACHYRHLPVEDVMARAGIDTFGGQKVKKCSGGQVQRLRFALALLTDPQLLILDEPTAGMDASARRDFWNSMHAEAERGRTIVFATHYLQEADDYADRVVLLGKGRVVADGSVADMTNGHGKTVEGIWHGRTEGLEPEEVCRRFGGDNIRFEYEGARIAFTTSNSDALALFLLERSLISDVRVTRPSMENVFFELTDDQARSER
ncbi:ABC transporter ATP-binding protein [Ancrocorticia populi]|uniref:ABC transporter ATP-binding protein n=1 Tax=Ancrocorticia populi TaxID=2175228 RepID=A0A2V1K7B2_9ACTO|nr:ABC transporter ATP-binding protein [Ancrocorticia populi]MDN6487523.1 ABC transporter ATP-binding protein [Ancrocorticia sp.]PWF26993.1 ABC transporter ATP-binding protein [Ancrocorticia populi]